MTKTDTPTPNTFFIEVSGAGLPEVDGLYIPSTAPPAESESGTLSSMGFWNGKPAFDRADGKAKRSPAISYSNSYKSWRISRLDGHLAYEITCDDALALDQRGIVWMRVFMGISICGTQFVILLRGCTLCLRSKLPVLDINPRGCWSHRIIRLHV